MKLVERHVSKRGHKLFAEIDRLCFASKNLYNLSNEHSRLRTELGLSVRWIR